MAKVTQIHVGVASPVDVRRALLQSSLPHRRRHGERSMLYPLHVLKEWLQRHRQRRELRMMDDALLRDAGLDPDAARAEARRPFFLPIHLDRSRD